MALPSFQPQPMSYRSTTLPHSGKAPPGIPHGRRCDFYLSFFSSEKLPSSDDIFRRTDYRGCGAADFASTAKAHEKKGKT
jgi:hypothetical protein